MRRPRGFTLIELMVVVTLIGVIAAVAVVSMRRGRSTGDVDAWANTLRNMSAQAHARAVATKQAYLIDLRSSPPSARWCQVTVDGSTCSLTSCATPPTTCPNAATGAENGSIVYAPADAKTDSTAVGVDVLVPGTTWAALTRTTLTSDQIYYGPRGTVDDDLPTVVSGLGAGFTVYLLASNNVAGTATAANQMRRKVVIYGPSGRARIIDQW